MAVPGHAGEQVESDQPSHVVRPGPPGHLAGRPCCTTRPCSITTRVSPSTMASTGSWVTTRADRRSRPDAGAVRRGPATGSGRPGGQRLVQQQHGNCQLHERHALRRLRACHPTHLRSWELPMNLRPLQGRLRPRRLRHRPPVPRRRRSSPSCRQPRPLHPRGRADAARQRRVLRRQDAARDAQADAAHGPATRTSTTTASTRPGWPWPGRWSARTATCQEPEWFNKPPGTDSPTPPHQDNYYFSLKPPNVLTIWLALDPVDDENGCLRYVAGSHRDGHPAARPLEHPRLLAGHHRLRPGRRGPRGADPPAAGRRGRPPRQDDPPGRPEPLRRRATAGPSPWSSRA